MRLPRCGIFEPLPVRATGSRSATLSVMPSVHRALTRRFPHAVYFVVERERIVVIGVFHQHRDPASWRDRA